MVCMFFSLFQGVKGEFALCTAEDKPGKMSTFFSLLISFLRVLFSYAPRVWFVPKIFFHLLNCFRLYLFYLTFCSTLHLFKFPKFYLTFFVNLALLSYFHFFVYIFL